MKNIISTLKILMFILLFSNNLYSSVLVKADSVCYGGSILMDGYAKLGIKTSRIGEKAKVNIFIKRKGKAYHLPLPIKTIIAEHFNLMYYNVNLGYGLNIKKGDTIIIKTKSGSYNFPCK